MDDDDLPPCVGEAYRDALHDLLRNLIDPNNEEQSHG
jgi:hypothetical protein